MNEEKDPLRRVFLLVLTLNGMNLESASAKMVFMKKWLLIGLVGVGAVISACQTPDMALSDSKLAQTPAWRVSGRQGFLFRQKLTYGAFTTSRVKRGWTRSYQIPFFVHFQGARQRLSFTQYSVDSSMAEVMAVSKFQSKELPLLRDFFRITLDYENSFAGVVVLNGDSNQTWEFLMHSVAGNLFREVGGFARNGQDSILIQPVTRFNRANSWSGPGVLGYEFVQNGQVLGAVELINRGKVWVQRNLEPPQQLLVSSLSSALLLYQNVEDQVPERRNPRSLF